MQPVTGRRFSDRFGRLMAAAALREPQARPGYRTTADGSTITERLLQCIWFDQLVKPDALYTHDGRPVCVRAPGFWNFEAGPDFRRAEIQFGEGAPIHGDVEVHFNSSEWAGHGHGLDPAYNDTILHVVFSPSRSGAEVRTAGGTPIPEVVIGDALVDELDALRAQLDTDEYPFASERNVGACCRHGFTDASPEFWKLIGLAGEARLLLKARRAEAVSDDADQVCWGMLLRALGYKQFAVTCSDLAERAPFQWLCQVAETAGSRGPDALEAALLGLAGLLPANAEDIVDPDARERCGVLQDLWARIAQETTATPMRPEAWVSSHVRPANRPARRLAAAAQYVLASSELGLASTLRNLLVEPINARQAWSNLESWLTVEGDSFWRVRGGVDRSPWPRPQRLVGAGRARVLAIDAVVPSLLAWARREGDVVFESRLHEVLSAAPAQDANSKLRFALYRMCGRPDAWPRDYRSALHGQGLLHVLQEWCLERPTCEGCGVFQVLGGNVTIP